MSAKKKAVLTKRQQAAVKKDYLAWSGGSPPNEHDKDYVDCGAHDSRLDEQAVRDFVEKWGEEEEAKATALYEKNRVRLKITDRQRKGLFKISKKNLKDLAKAERSVSYGDLTRHLHHVGDDIVKMEVEQALVQLLDEETFCKVVGVFAMAVSDDV